jgi:hypothetical protein
MSIQESIRGYTTLSLELLLCILRFIQVKIISSEYILRESKRRLRTGWKVTSGRRNKDKSRILFTACNDIWSWINTCWANIENARSTLLPNWRLHCIPSYHQTPNNSSAQLNLATATAINGGWKAAGSYDFAVQFHLEVAISTYKIVLIKRITDPDTFKSRESNAS